MSAAQVGGIFGAVIGLAGFVALRFAADKIQSSARDDGGNSRVADLLRMLAIADMLLLPLIGYLVGHFVISRG